MGLEKKIKLCFRLIPVIFLFALSGLGFLFSSMPVTDGGSCGGTVEGDSVKYVRNDIKYISLEELGINPNDVVEGENIFLKFNTENKVSGWEYGRVLDFRSNIGMVLMSLSLVPMVIIASIRCTGEGRFTSYEAKYHFYQTYLLNGKIYLCRWLVPEGGSLSDVQELRFDKGEILSLINIIKSRRYEHVTRMRVILYDELHCKQQNRKIWVASSEYDVIEDT